MFRKERGLVLASQLEGESMSAHIIFSLLLCEIISYHLIELVQYQRQVYNETISGQVKARWGHFGTFYLVESETKGFCCRPRKRQNISFQMRCW